jgi:ATP-binding cassette subfamily D (ALD) long-chain fatty acid import protein
LAGSLRHTHSRLSEFAEEIVFFGGEETEKRLIERDYAELVQHEHKVMNKRWWYGCAEEGIFKWLWGSFGVCTRQVVSWNTITFILACRLCNLQAAWDIKF